MRGRDVALKKTSILLLAAVLCLILMLPSCSGGSNEETKAPGTVVAETQDTVTIVDMAGREVEVPKNPASCAFVYRVIARFLISLDQGGNIVGQGKPEEFLETVQPSLGQVPSIGMGVVDLEALAEVNPQVFFHKAGDVKTLDAVSELGIPAIGLSFENEEEILLSLDIMGKVCGAEEKAADLTAFYEKGTGILEEKRKTLPQEERHTAILMGTTIGDVADGSMLQSRMIEDAGGVNPAADMDAAELWPTVGVEEIFQWDPEYIFITNSQDATYTPEDLMSDPAWSAMTAVKKKQIYVMPSILDSWEFPGIVSVLGSDYMMHIMYPERLGEEELDSEVAEFYQLSYGMTFSREELGY